MAEIITSAMRGIDGADFPEPLSRSAPLTENLHTGVVLTGENGDDGHKAFYIHIEARPGREEDVVQMLRDIYGCVLDEPATGPWFGVRYTRYVFGIFEAFPNIAGRDAHVTGGGGDIFRDHARMTELLVRPAHVFRLDVLLNKADIGRSIVCISAQANWRCFRPSGALPSSS